MSPEGISLLPLSDGQIEEEYGRSKKKRKRRKNIRRKGGGSPERRRNQRRKKGVKICPRCNVVNGWKNTICQSCGRDFYLHRHLVLPFLITAGLGVVGALIWEPNS